MNHCSAPVAPEEEEDVEERMQHLEEGTIHAWLDGALDDLEAARVAKHAEECEACGSMVAEARGLIAGASRIVSSLDIVRGGVIPKPESQLGRQQLAARRNSLWKRLHLSPARAAIAATVLVAVSSMLAVREVGRDSVANRSRAIADEKVQAAAQPPVAAPLPAAPAPAVMAADSTSLAAPRDLARDRRELAATSSSAAANERSAKREAVALEKQTANVGGAGAAQARKNAPSVTVPATPAPASASATGRVAGGVASDAASSEARSRRLISDAPPNRQVDSIAVASRIRDSLGTRADQRLRDSGRVALEQVRVSPAQSSFAAQAKTAATTANAAVGCYSFGGDLPPWASAVPRRFALDASPVADSTPEVRVVRAVNGANIDAPIRLASWRVASDGAGVARAVVTWPTGSSPITITIELNGFTQRLATISDVGHSQGLQLTRISCSSR
jgi:hypothetical protein